MDNSKGELLLQTSVKRTAIGVQITVKAHARLEEAIKLLVPTEPGTDTRLPNRPVGDYGRFWTSEKELMVYALPADMSGSSVVGTGRLRYRLDRPGQALELNDPDPNTGGRVSSINLSFLRLVGLQEGVTFSVGVVYSRDGIADLVRKIEEATKQFYFQYLKPVCHDVEILTREI